MFGRVLSRAFELVWLLEISMGVGLCEVTLVLESLLAGSVSSALVASACCSLISCRNISFRSSDRSLKYRFSSS